MGRPGKEDEERPIEFVIRVISMDDRLSRNRDRGVARRVSTTRCDR